jgi:hypothetical protein
MQNPIVWVDPPSKQTKAAVNENNKILDIVALQRLAVCQYDFLIHSLIVHFRFMV